MMDLRVPNIELAHIPNEKLIDYLLNERHPQGGGKARFFRPLGYNERFVGRFTTDLKTHALQNPVISGREIPYGIHYLVEGPMETPSGRRVQVISIWIVENGVDAPRLVTAYPGKLQEADG